MKRIRLHPDSVFSGSGSFGGLIKTAAVHIEQPAMIRTTDTARFNAAQRQVGAAVSTLPVDQTDVTIVIAKQHQVFAHDTNGLRCSAGGHESINATGCQ
jgi:hypothetical protein